MKGCFAVGLYRQGICHDLSKYSWTEFRVGAKYYQGNRSPNNAEREDIGYSSAWLHHKGRNRHHYEYWVDYSTQSIEGGMAPVPMPRKYVAEMLTGLQRPKPTGEAPIKTAILSRITKMQKSRRLCTRRQDGSWNTS